MHLLESQTLVESSSGGGVGGPTQGFLKDLCVSAPQTSSKRLQKGCAANCHTSPLLLQLIASHSVCVCVCVSSLSL